jgi:hypothetical protein
VTDREKGLRDYLTKLAASPNISPEFQALSLENSMFLLDELLRMRDGITKALQKLQECGASTCLTATECLLVFTREGQL